MKIYIYTLIDPRDNQVRYVGKTNNILTRLSNHISNAKRIKHNRHVCNWIKELLSFNLKPIFNVLEEFDSDEWKVREPYWIEYYKSIGCKLTNHSTGGESGAIGVIRDASYKQNLSKIMKGNSRAKGAVRTPEMRKRQSEHNSRGNAVLTEQEVIKVCQLVNQGLKGRAIKKQVPNIKPHILWNIKNGKSWKHITSKYLINGNGIS